MFALIFQNKVVQIEAKTFTVHPDLVWIDITGLSLQPEFGWTYNDDVFTAPLEPPPKDTDQMMFDKLSNSPGMRALIAGLAEMRGMTPAQVKTWLRNKL